MTRLWPLAFLLFLLALPLRAQEEGEAAPADEAPPPETAVQEPSGQGEEAPSEEAPVPAGTAAEPNSAEGEAVPAEDGEAAPPKGRKEEPIVSVKVVTPAGEEGEEESTAPAPEKKKIESTLLVQPKKGKAAKGSKPAKAKKAAAPAVAKAKAPVVPPEPPPPPAPAVPLTPITPRNP